MILHQIELSDIDSPSLLHTFHYHNTAASAGRLQVIQRLGENNLKMAGQERFVRYFSQRQRLH